MKKTFISLLSLIFLSLASAQTYVELILDASGSMWNKLENGEYRIVAAKQVLSDFIKGLPSGDLNVGLRVYGSRIAALDDGSCEDTELFVPMTGVDKTALQGTVDEVTATGATPIALSLQKAAEDFPAEASQRMIVLVTDGEESCGGDLQAVAEQLRQQGFEIDLKIIGFALDEKAQQSFEGLGEFVNAEDAESLASALEGAVEAVVEEPVLEATERGTVTLSAPDTTSAGRTFEISYEGDIQQDDYITLVSPDTEDGSYSREWKYVDAEGLSSLSLTASIEPGNYEIRYMDEKTNPDTVLTRLAITVEPSEITLNFPEEVLVGSTFEVNWTGPDGAQDYITIVPASAPEGTYQSYFYTANANPGTLTAPSFPGQYEVRYSTDRGGESGKNFYSQTITILPALYSLTAPDQVTAGSPFEVSWQGPNGAQDYITIVPANAPEGTYQSYFYTANANPGTLTAPVEPGNYEVRYSTDRGDAKGSSFYTIPITVTPASFSLTAPAEVNAGEQFEVSWTGPDGPSDYITIVPAGAPDGEYMSYFYTAGNNPGNLKAPDTPGQYEIRYSSDRGDAHGKNFYSIPITVK
ncbi:MAG: VWA domain-containing protein [Trueperaceae bacterium]|nr:VWA domain-containing protein [Trueperaceae bacterium]